MLGLLFSLRAASSSFPLLFARLLSNWPLGLYRLISSNHLGLLGILGALRGLAGRAGQVFHLIDVLSQDNPLLDDRYCARRGIVEH